MKEGEIAPNFILKDQDGKEFELYKNLETQLLLVFYPKDNTPVCAMQLSEYNDNLNNFNNTGIKVVGINSDSINSHISFCSKLKLKFPLLIDEHKEVSNQFGAINIFGMNKRMLVLIGTDKKILWLKSTLSIRFIKAYEIVEKVKSLSVKK